MPCERGCWNTNAVTGLSPSPAFVNVCGQSADGHIADFHARLVPMLKKYGCLDRATWADAKNTAWQMMALLQFAALSEHLASWEILKAVTD
jgi:hypothetical protein